MFKTLFIIKRKNNRFYVSYLISFNIKKGNNWGGSKYEN